MAEIDLIKTVRGLDQSGPGEKAENLNQLWSSLAASSNKHFHAAEESILRWLLKVMNGSSPAAETMRRYPLTWRILSCVFARIPLFPLAKSLVDRRFFTVLQQSVNNISTPSHEESTPSSGKRKRSTSSSFSIDQLKTPEACIESGQALFLALRSLLRRVDDTEVAAARERTGAEHLKLILGTSAAEAVSIAAPLLRICDLLLVEGQVEEVDGCERWIDDISSLWGLHLQGEDDTEEIARHVFTPVATLLQKLEGLQDDTSLSMPNTLRERWSADLQRMMCRSFIFPARSGFLNRDDVGSIFIALTGRAPKPELSLALPQTAPALYLLASSATQELVQAGIRKGNAEWMKKVFRQIDESVKPRDDRMAIMNTVLRLARKKAMPVDTQSLQTVCDDYGLQDGKTDWTLVANLSQCDPDVFHNGETGAQLLEKVCDRSLGEDVGDVDYPAVSEVLSAVVRGFRAARDYPSFLRLWYKQLAKIEKRDVKAALPWQSLRSEASPWIEQSLSPRQLTELLEWVGNEKIRGGALCIWLSAICEGLKSPAYTEAAGQTIFDLALKVKKSSSETTALKWRIAGQAIQWAPISNHDEEGGEENLEENWQKISKSVQKILKKGALDAPETLEAFKCSSAVWVHSAPDGTLTKDVGELVSKFDDRLAAEVFASKQLHAFLASGESLTKVLDSEFNTDSALLYYLAWFFRGSSRLYGFIFKRTGELPLFVRRVLFETSGCDSGLIALWASLWDNEQCTESKLAGEVIDRLIQSTISLKQTSTWPEKDSCELLRLISLTPLDSYDDTQIEKLMLVLVDITVSKKQGNEPSLHFWNIILSLCGRLMTRPTIYEGMSIDHLSDIAATLSNACIRAGVEQHEFPQLINGYYGLASSTVRQVAEAATDEKASRYFEEAKNYVDRATKGKKSSPLQPTLLKALRTGITDPDFPKREVAATLLEKTDEALGSSVHSVIESWTTDKKLFAKPSVDEDLRLYAAIDACECLPDAPTLKKLKTSSLRKLEKRSSEAMKEGDARGWKMQTFLQRFLSTELEIPRPASFHELGDGRESLMRDYVGAIVKSLDAPLMMMYLQALLGEYFAGSETSGQLVAIQYVVDKLIESTDPQGSTEDFDLSTAHSELTRALPSVKTTTNAILIARTLHSILEKKPHSISQWNVESLLDAIAAMSSAQDSVTPFEWQCILMETVIKKHRLRLEGHFHILLSALQPLLRNLLTFQRSGQETKATAFTRLLTLVCEPTVGAVSRGQNHNALDSATATAKRLAGRHMHMVLMQYVKLQLETDTSRPVREALEPGMNSIFGILSSDSRKILNDAMDASGRAILREMFKQYTQYGRWKGI